MLATTKAINLLKELHIESNIIPDWKILHHLKIELSYQLGEGISGVLIRKGDIHQLGVSINQGELKRRCIIAHLIGHFILHKGKAELFVDIDYMPLANNKMELEANEFAGALLIPEEKIKEKIELIKELPIEEKIKYLAKTFQVTNCFMINRLAKLSII